MARASQSMPHILTKDEIVIDAHFPSRGHRTRVAAIFKPTNVTAYHGPDQESRSKTGARLVACWSYEWADGPYLHTPQLVCCHAAASIVQTIVPHRFSRWQPFLNMLYHCIVFPPLRAPPIRDSVLAPYLSTYSRVVDRTFHQ